MYERRWICAFVCLCHTLAPRARVKPSVVCNTPSDRRPSWALARAEIASLRPSTTTHARSCANDAGAWVTHAIGYPLTRLLLIRSSHGASGHTPMVFPTWSASRDLRLCTSAKILRRLGRALNRSQACCQRCVRSTPTGME